MNKDEIRFMVRFFKETSAGNREFFLSIWIDDVRFLAKIIEHMQLEDGLGLRIDRISR